MFENEYMVFQKVTFARLFSTSGTYFGFESDGKRFFDVVAPGRPRIVQGMTVIALVETPNGFEGNGLLGWVDCDDGSIACDSALKHFCWFLAGAYFAYMSPLRAYDIIATPANANGVAWFVAALFGFFALASLYLSVKTLLIKRALVAVRELIKGGFKP